MLKKIVLLTTVMILFFSCKTLSEKAEEDHSTAFSDKSSVQRNSDYWNAYRPQIDKAKKSKKAQEQAWKALLYWSDIFLDKNEGKKAYNLLQEAENIGYIPESALQSEFISRRALALSEMGKPEAAVQTIEEYENQLKSENKMYQSIPLGVVKTYVYQKNKNYEEASETAMLYLTNGKREGNYKFLLGVLGWNALNSSNKDHQEYFLAETSTDISYFDENIRLLNFIISSKLYPIEKSSKSALQWFIEGNPETIDDWYILNTAFSPYLPENDPYQFYNIEADLEKMEVLRDYAIVLGEVETDFFYNNYIEKRIDSAKSKKKYEADYLVIEFLWTAKKDNKIDNDSIIQFYSSFNGNNYPVFAYGPINHYKAVLKSGNADFEAEKLREMYISMYPENANSFYP